MLRPSPSIPLLLLHLSPSGVFFSVIPNTPDSKASSCLNSVHPLFSWESRSFNPTFPSEANDTEAQRQVSVLSLFRWTAVSLSLALTHSSSLGTDFFLFHCTVIMCCREEIFLRSSFSLTTFHILLSENRHRLLVFSFCLFFFFEAWSKRNRPQVSRSMWWCLPPHSRWCSQLSAGSWSWISTVISLAQQREVVP